MVSGVLFFGFSVLVNMRIPVSLCCESRSVFRKVFCGGFDSGSG